MATQESLLLVTSEAASRTLNDLLLPDLAVFECVCCGRFSTNFLQPILMADGLCVTAVMWSVQNESAQHRNVKVV
jgi:hypothetical protein